MHEHGLGGCLQARQSQARCLPAQSYVILRHAYLENREFEPCPVELPTGSPALRNLTTVLYNLFSLFNPLQARPSCASPCDAGHALSCDVCCSLLKSVCSRVSMKSVMSHHSAIYSWAGPHTCTSPTLEVIQACARLGASCLVVKSLGVDDLRANLHRMARRGLHA